jgi:hypothetical protein
MNFRSPQTCNWQGASGAIFPHLVFPLCHDLPVAAVNYIMARRETDGRVCALYIGHTKDGSVRFPQHEKLGWAKLLGGNELHLLFGGTKQQRLDIETDLRHAYRAPLNEQPTPASAPIAGFADPLAALLAFGPTIPPRRVLGLDKPINEGVAGLPFGSLAPDLRYTPGNALAKGAKPPVRNVLAALLRLE